MCLMLRQLYCRAYKSIKKHINAQSYHCQWSPSSVKISCLDADYYRHVCFVVNRPYVARAILQTALSLIQSVTDGLCKYLYSPTIGNGDCSHKIDQIAILQDILNLEGRHNRITGLRATAIYPIGHSGEASWLRVCYQRGLPRLVSYPPQGLRQDHGPPLGKCKSEEKKTFSVQNEKIKFQQ